MKIMIDGMNLALAQGTGVATYARNLARCVKLNGHHLSVLYGKPIYPYRDMLLREAMFFDDYKDKLGPLGLAQAAAGCFSTHMAAEVRQSGRVLTDHIRGRLPQADAFFNIQNLFRMADLRSSISGGMLRIETPYPVDIAHWTYPVAARIEGARNIYTLHDLVPLKLPYATLDSKSHYFRVLKTLSQTADHFVTVSEASKADIVDMLKVEPDFVTNTYQSVDIPQTLLDETPEQHAIDLNALSLDEHLGVDGFYLYVGAIEPKKNLKRIIEGYLSSGVPHPLIVVGRRGWRFKEEMSLIERSRRIHYLDYVPFAQLITLIRSARALVFASLYEGFGLPILEAFMCETPVITADASSTAEIAGGAAHLVNPYSVTDLRDAFRTLSAPSSDQLRKDMAQAGRARAEMFTEDRIAGEIGALYDRLMETPPRQ